ncbi:MAG: transketolase [Gammaproteobacteria bacterium]|nr:transketolase [Gammaproteobacteria bacterium]
MPRRRHLANAIRALAMDSVQKANSGHPGMPMGMADIAEVLWNDFLKHNPANPNWINRDRFILSNGHGAMLHYALLHLTGYDLSIEDLQQFRQLHSRTPGHPEFGLTPGVETTTGPLGQGLANAVGMAIAEKKLASDFNRADFSIINHFTYVFVGDGCLMEGISHEACSLAGVLGLGKLIAFYDDNGISIDGEVANWYKDDTPARFNAYGWHVIPHVDGHDAESIRQAILEAQAVEDKPTLICCRTVIAYGAPTLAGTSEAHGAPLGEEEIRSTRKALGWEFPPFSIPGDIYEGWNAKDKGRETEQLWQAQFDAYLASYPELAKEFVRRIEGKMPDNWQEESTKFISQLNDKHQEMATRKASKLCLDAFGPLLPEMMGGSADLTGSNLTLWDGSHTFSNETPSGNYIYYGVREFGMFAIMNGIALHKGLLPYGGTFLTFVDYGKNAVRLSALMKAHVVYVLTHDSVGLGEDGPTHQPIEHISMLRLIPNLYVWRPGDAVETAVAWKYAIENKVPSCLLLSRQNIAPQSHANNLNEIARGGYILTSTDRAPDLILIATGSEVSLAVEAADKLQQDGIAVRVVSMPCLEVFEEQPNDYREHVLPSESTCRIVIEAGSTAPWYKYVGLTGKVIGIDRFGESAPYKDVFKTLGFTTENVVTTAKTLLNK